MIKAAIELIAAVQNNHDTKDAPLKYTVPWGAVVNLHNALGGAPPVSSAPSATSADPMDWPLPCDVTVGHGTMRKGVALRTLVMRMKVLYEMATGRNADEVEQKRHAEEGILSRVVERANRLEWMNEAATLPAVQPEAETSAEKVAYTPNEIYGAWRAVGCDLTVSWDDFVKALPAQADAPVAEPVALVCDQDGELVAQWVVEDPDMHVEAGDHLYTRPPAPEEGTDAELRRLALSWYEAHMRMFDSQEWASRNRDRYAALIKHVAAMAQGERG